MVDQLDDMHPLTFNVLDCQVVVYTDFMSVTALRLLDLECYKSRKSLNPDLAVVLLSTDNGVEDVLSITSKPCSRIRSVAQFSQDKVSSVKKRVF